MDLGMLLDRILEHYTLSFSGIHGIWHWGRVMENGLRLAQRNGANQDVIRLFALFHDSQRLRDGYDPEHGERGAALASRFRDQGLFELDDENFELLHYACCWHEKGLTDGDLTVRVCWDADRLDLARIGIVPDPNRLCTDEGREEEIRQWASQRALAGTIPQWIEDWLDARWKKVL